MPSIRNIVLISFLLLLSNASGQIDTLREIDKIIPLQLVKSLINNNVDNLNLFCIDDTRVVCERGELYDHEVITIKGGSYVVFVELTDKLFDKKTIWRFYLQFTDPKNDNLFLSLLPPYLGYHFKDGVYYGGFMQTIGMNELYDTGREMIEVWLYYPPLNLDNLKK
jgi:hypothetical protein